MADEQLPVQLACRILGVSESGYYAWKSRPPSQRLIRHAWLTDLIVQVHADSRQTYGAKRVHAELTLGHGITVSHGAVELLIRRAGIQGITGRPKFRRVPNVATASNLVERQSHRDDPNRLWVTDITEHPTTWIPAVVATPRHVLSTSRRLVHRRQSDGLAGHERAWRLHWRSPRQLFHPTRWPSHLYLHDQGVATTS